MPRSNENSGNSGSGGSDQPVDFGAFVEQNIQRTSAKLKGDQPAPTAAAPTESTRPGGDRRVERVRDRSYWRRKAAGETDAPEDDYPPAPARSSRNRYLPPSDEEIEQFHDGKEFGGGGFGGNVGRFFDGDDGNRNRIIAAVLALILLVLIVFSIARLFQDDSGDGGDVTPTPTQVIEGPSTPATLPAETETPPAGPTQEPEIPRGGDNQRDGGVSPDTDVGTAVAVATIEITNDVARACTGHCLVRMVGADQHAALDAAGARISWGEGDLSWLVVSQEQAQLLSETHELTLIETDPRTYNVYVAKAADDFDDSSVITPHGTIIDQVDGLYLVRWNSVPAIVKPVTDWGYAVYKIAPAPPASIAELGRNGSANDLSGWQLLEQVSQSNIEAVMDDLVHIGELDNSGWGTRYYTYPGNQIAADYLYQELESYGFTVWYEDFIMWDGYLLVNVVAEIPGADDSEVYAMMAHFDTINLENSRIAPGADDNATGIATVLEVGRILAGYELEHPVRIAFVNAEEVGIIGSPAWARQSNANNVPVAGVFNVDSVGSVRNRPILITNADANSAWMQDLLTDVNNEYGLGESMQNYQSDKIVADDNLVRDQGIPAVMIARELYGESDFHHTAEDIPANMTFGGVVDTTNIVLLSLWTLVK